MPMHCSTQHKSDHGDEVKLPTILSLLTEQLPRTQLMMRVGFCFFHVDQVARPVLSRLKILHGHFHFSLRVYAHRNSLEITIVFQSFFVAGFYSKLECLFLILMPHCYLSCYYSDHFL